ncbi:hypothetical protein [Kitasatospora indigofera]|uniref:hypothetical protein n=1 Tax=Kitasatospora indigofera TaxID=67307 RepID=UPI0033BB9D8F
MRAVDKQARPPRPRGWSGLDGARTLAAAGAAGVLGFAGTVGVSAGAVAGAVRELHVR